MWLTKWRRWHKKPPNPEKKGAKAPLSLFVNHEVKLKITTNIKEATPKNFTLESLAPETLFRFKETGEVGIRLYDSYVIIRDGWATTAFSRIPSNDPGKCAVLPSGDAFVEILPKGTSFTFTQE